MKNRNIYLLLSIFILFSLGCKKLEVSEKDKQLFVRPNDFSSFGFNFKNLQNNEKIEKSKLFDGSYQIDYEVESPENEQNNPLALIQTVTIETKNSDATISKGADETGFAIGLKIGGIEREEVPDFYKYGDSSSFYLLKKNGNKVGNYFVMRKGKKTYSLFIAGVYIDDIDIWREIVEPKLNALEAYSID